MLLTVKISSIGSRGTYYQHYLTLLVVMNRFQLSIK